MAKKQVFNRTEKYFVATETEETLETLPSGVYKIHQPRGLFGPAGPVYFEQVEFNMDELVALPGSIGEEITKDIETFWADETVERFREFGFVHKRGILLHGEPGTGKSATITMVMDDIISRGGVALFNPEVGAIEPAVKSIRANKKDVPIVVVFEEFDNYYNNAPETLLSLLDGQLQFGNIVYLATTNHIHEIPNRLKNRPSRFAVVKELEMPTAEERRYFLEKKLPENQKSGIDMWLKHTDGLPFDHMKELIICVCCLGMSIGNAVDRIQGLDRNKDQGAPKAKNSLTVYHE